MNCNIVVLPGDGIGPEVIREAIKVLESVGRKYSHHFSFEYYLLGGCATDSCGTPLPNDTWEACKSAEAILVGAVGGPKWDKLPVELRPEQGFKEIRLGLQLFANLRPVKLLSGLETMSPLKNEIASRGIDIMIVRELTGGIYFGEKTRSETQDKGEKATDLMSYTTFEIERIGRRAFELAEMRSGVLTSVDKANVLENSRLWREVMHRLAAEYPQVKYNDLYVDNAAMQLIKAPYSFDVLVTENMFGDILSDEASMLSGSIGLLPSASLGSNKTALYEPVHGSAPDIAGRNEANPIAAILSAAMMLRYSFSMSTEADDVEAAVEEVLRTGMRTLDLFGETPAIGTVEMGDAICFCLENR